MREKVMIKVCTRLRDPASCLKSRNLCQTFLSASMLYMSNIVAIPCDGAVIGVGVLVYGDDGEAVTLSRAAHRGIATASGREADACV